MAGKRINYLNNRDLLKEIHKSKNSYSYYIDKIYENYDIILSSIEEINEENILNAKRNRSERLYRIEKEKLTKKDKDIKPIPIEEIKNTEIVFRIMTDEHIPEEILKNKKVKNNSTKDKVIKLNFDPYKHYIIEEDGTLKEVGRSHWKNGLHNGEFCLNQGRITDILAMMFIKLVERYSQRGNWRGYTWIEDMKGQALVQLMETALKFSEQKSQNPFSYFTCIVTNCFRGTLNSEEKVSNIKNRIMMESGYNASYDYQIKKEMEDSD